ncbi:MAG: aminotransferase class I/II-fold pyridoxal phosphate-dependent enzyme, partial [Eudoraea sp.]|nr:aminotransferase class I/II-fold pyridoxal phosphate-dependent enzyme [Eudoraea sp.]
GIRIENASDFAMYLLENANVATVTGEAFGNPNCIRISYAASESELREAAVRIKSALA